MELRHLICTRLSEFQKVHLLFFLGHTWSWKYMGRCTINNGKHTAKLLKGSIYKCTGNGTVVSLMVDD